MVDMLVTSALAKAKDKRTTENKKPSSPDGCAHSTRGAQYAHGVRGVRCRKEGTLEAYTLAGHQIWKRMTT